MWNLTCVSGNKLRRIVARSVSEGPALTGSSSFTPAQHAALIAHYDRVAPLMTAAFGGTPLVAGFVHDWATKIMTYEETLPHPPTLIPTVHVPLKAGDAVFAAVAENAILWQAHRGAIAFLGWSPTRSDPRVGYGRLLFQPYGVATSAMVRETALVFRALLQSYGLQCIAILGGESGVSLWIPSADAPLYEPVRKRLDSLADEAAYWFWHGFFWDIRAASRTI